MMVEHIQRYLNCISIVYGYYKRLRNMVIKMYVKVEVVFRQYRIVRLLTISLILMKMVIKINNEHIKFIHIPE